MARQGGASLAALCAAMAASMATSAALHGLYQTRPIATHEHTPQINSSELTTLCISPEGTSRIPHCRPIVDTTNPSTRSRSHQTRAHAPRQACRHSATRDTAARSHARFPGRVVAAKSSCLSHAREISSRRGSQLLRASDRSGVRNGRSIYRVTPETLTACYEAAVKHPRATSNGRCPRICSQAGGRCAACQREVRQVAVRGPVCLAL